MLNWRSLFCSHADRNWQHGNGPYGLWHKATCANCGKELGVYDQAGWEEQISAKIEGIYYGNGQLAIPEHAKELVKVGMELDCIIMHQTTLSDAELGGFVRELFTNPTFEHLQALRKTWEL